MATKKICDACGNDMTGDPANGRLAVDYERNALELRQYDGRVWPNCGDLRINIGIVELLPKNLARHIDVCTTCIVRAVTDGPAVDLGLVTR